MKIRILLIGSILAALLGAGAWFGWDWYTAPAPPDIPLETLSKEMGEAIGKAQQEVRRHPRSAKAWGELSMVLMGNGFLEPALPCLVQAERLAPQSPRWPYLRGTLLRTSDPREGIRALRRALALTQSPEKQAEVLFTLAQALVEEELLDEAEEHLRALGEIEPDSPRLHYGLGLVALARDDQAAARDHLSKLTESPFARKRACSFLAQLNKGNPELALSYEQRARRLKPDASWPNSFVMELTAYKVDPMRKRIALYYELDEQGRRAEAVEFLRQYVAKSPDEMVCYMLGFALLTVNDFDGAAHYLRQTLQFNPHNVKANLYLGNALLRKGEKRSREPDGKEAAEALFQEALGFANTAVKLQGDLAFGHLVRGEALKALGQKEESLKALREALLLGPEYADMHLALGEALAEMGQVAEGLEHLKHAVKLATPQDDRPRQALEKWQARSQTP